MVVKQTYQSNPKYNAIYKWCSMGNMGEKKSRVHIQNTVILVC